MGEFLMIPLATALGVFLLVALAEWLHARRIRVAERLAFGPAGVRAWTRFVPLLRALSLAAVAWGLLTLILTKTGTGDHPKEHLDLEATRLVFVADLSPSMYLADAGPDGTQTRQARMREVVEGILQRVSGNLRYGVIGFHTGALPVVMGARDPELVRNVFNGLPLSYAMPAGKTDLGQAVNASLELVARFPEGSTRLILFTDGDTVSLTPILARPESVEEVFVLGVGDPDKGTFIDGHQSRQDRNTLLRLAASLKGAYHDVNTKHLATAVLGDLVAPLPPKRRNWGLAQFGLLAMIVGAAVHALLPVALEFSGSAWHGLQEGRRERAQAG